MDSRESKVELLKALMEFQKDCPVLYKDSSAHNKNYVNLTTVDATIKPLLRKHGLLYTQFLEGISVNTTIWHADTGASISGTFEIPAVEAQKGMNGYQNIGSGITYIRRYALCSALGIIADADKDATGLTQGLSDYVDELKACDNIDDLQNMYKNLSSKVKQSNKVVTAFATRKKELEG